jgi:hypothetical protein
MNKIIKALLESKFSNTNVEALLELINVSPNPQVATEILCGLYEEKIVPSDKQAVLSRDYGVYVLQSYSKWTDEVEYTYEYPDTKGGYFPDHIKKEDVNMDNFKELQVNSSSSSNYLHIPTGTSSTRKNRMSFSSWISMDSAM